MPATGIQARVVVDLRHNPTEMRGNLPMLQLNETLVTLDPAEALADEAGVFDVTSPR